MERSLLALILFSFALFSVLELIYFPATIEARMGAGSSSSAIENNDLIRSTEPSMEDAEGRKLRIKVLMERLTTEARRPPLSPPPPCSNPHGVPISCP